METNKQWQAREMRRTIAVKTYSYFDNARNFSEGIAGKSAYLLEQLEWIASGNYGAGECFVLQAILRRCEGTRQNVAAQVGQWLLTCMYGKPIRWCALSAKAQRSVSSAVRSWLRCKRKEFGQILEK